MTKITTPMYDENGVKIGHIEQHEEGCYATCEKCGAGTKLPRATRLLAEQSLANHRCPSAKRAG